MGIELPIRGQVKKAEDAGAFIQGPLVAYITKDRVRVIPAQIVFGQGLGRKAALNHKEVVVGGGGLARGQRTFGGHGLWGCAPGPVSVQ